MKYELNIDLNVLNHLGLNLYSNVPAVLSELIANAWDADAGQVTIDVAGDKTSITIEDDGCGMSACDLNKKFLTVGYQRRKKNSDEKTAGKGRAVMGRKGIGKLSVFSIAENIEVITKTANGHELGIALNVKDIQEAIANKEAYHPKELTEVSKPIATESGTIIVLSELKKRISQSLTGNLKRCVARRFGIISNGFVVTVNNERVELKDKGYVDKLKHAFIYGDCDKRQFGNIDDHRIKERNNTVKVGESSYKVTGWIGSAKEHKDLKDKGSGDNLNRISIFCRGKMALEDISSSYDEGRIGRRYIMGEIMADFLDETDKDDITTSSRQDFVQDDERFVALKQFIGKEMADCISEREKIKEQEGEQKATAIPQVKAWFETLGEDSKRAAKILFAKINQIATEDNYKILLKHGVLAFEYMEHHRRLSELDNVSTNNIEEVIKVFASLDDVEAAWYYEITSGRLEKIGKLKEMTDANQLEKVVQEYIYDHLWLLDPSWDRATEQPLLEKGVMEAFDKVSSKLNKKEQKARIDIRYRKAADKHIIIELKRASSRPTFGALADQVDKYKRALSKQLEANNEKGSIEVFCLVGSKQLSGWEDKEKKQSDEKALRQKDIRVITYNQLIHDAEKSYREYLNKNKDKLGKLRAVMDALD